MKRQESMSIQAFRIGSKIKGGTNIPSHWERLSHEPLNMVVKSKYRIESEKCSMFIFWSTKMSIFLWSSEGEPKLSKRFCI